MKHKTWFRLVLKAIGVLLFGSSLVGVAHAIIALIDVVILQANRRSSFVLFYSMLQMIAALAPALLGLYLFFGGEWIVNKAIPSNRPYCPECGYDLSRSSGPRCPECGTAVTHDRKA